MAKGSKSNSPIIHANIFVSPSQLWPENSLKLRITRMPNINTTAKLSAFFSFLKQLPDTCKSFINRHKNVFCLQKRSYSHTAAFGQIGMWLACHSSKDLSAYNLLYKVKFHGALDIRDLRRAILSLINSHDALRSTFRWNNSELIVKVYEASKITIETENVTAGAVNYIDDIAKSFGAGNYDIIEGPLYRFKLLTINPDEHILLCGFHHLVMDGTSIKLFTDELIELVSNPIPLDTPVQYIDFCKWQQNQLPTKQWGEALNYWKNSLKDSYNDLKIPADKAHPNLPGNAGGHYQHKMTNNLADLIREHALKSGTSYFRVVFAGFFVFLNTISKSEDLKIATTLTGRSNPEFKKLIGLFVNTAIIRLKTPGDVNFNDLLETLSRTIDESVAIQDYPYYLAYKNVSFNHASGTDTFTPVSFTKLPARKYYQLPGGLTAIDGMIHLDYANRDLALYLQAVEDTFELTWNFRTEIFSHAWIKNLANQFESALTLLLQNPVVAFKKLDFTANGDSIRTLTSWNNNDQKFPDLACLSRLVEQQVERTPDHVAVITPHAQISYRELNNHANALGYLLQSKGIGPGSYVPVLMRSSSEQLISELAIIKCGAAFCPLDPEWPDNRIHTILEKLASPVVLTDSSIQANQIHPQYETVIVSSAANSSLVENLPTNITLEDPIYCIFTSGTTGVPKGAINQHKGIINRLRAMDSIFGPAKNDIILATAPAYVDTHVWQYFWPLIHGGKVVISTRENLVVPEKIIILIKQHAISFTDFVPSIFKLLVKHLAEHPEALSSLHTLKQVLIGGESMSADDVNQFMTLVPDINICNCYGPTETSIGVIFNAIRSPVTNPVPIGRPLANVKTIIVDDNLRLVPIGIPGELCIGGACVGLGYLNDIETTKHKFFTNPFPEINASNFYRTGDLARYRQDGEIEYLGRVDNQIKMRGMRIEPEEIETALNKHPLIDECVVRLEERQQHDMHLVAYLTTKHNEIAITETDLYTFLKQTLPAYMIPSKFIKIDSMPLSANGKIDRRALKQQRGIKLKSKSKFRTPSSELELKIVNLWAKILDKSQLGVDDDFFADHGADSLSTILFITQFTKQTSINISISDIYESPTAAALAKRLQTNGLPKHTRHQDSNSHDAAFKSQNFAQILLSQRNYLKSWRGWQSTPDSFLFLLNNYGEKLPIFWCFQGYQELSALAEQVERNQPVVGMRSGHLIMQYTEENIKALAATYAAEMMQMQPLGEFILGGNCQGGIIAQAVAQQLELHGRQVSLLILMEQNEFKQHTGKTALIFGEDSQFNPFLHQTDPEQFFKTIYPSFTLHLTSGAHGEFFNQKNIQSLASIIKKISAPYTSPDYLKSFKLCINHRAA
jgi:amino acid adenylation domain-containing protein